MLNGSEQGGQEDPQTAPYCGNACSNLTEPTLADAFQPDWVFGLCSVLISGTILGNSLVILAFWFEPKLKSLTNYWIVSLSTTDIILATIVMPIAAIKDASENMWFFGDAFCDAFISLDVLCCTCSIYHLCLISVDRFFCVRLPLSYPKRRTLCTTLIAILLTWIFCALLSSVRLLLWTDDSRGAHECSMTNSDYIVFSSCISFFLPLLIIISMYIAVYRITRRQMKKFSHTAHGKVKRKLAHARRDSLPLLVSADPDLRTPTHHKESVTITPHHKISLAPILPDNEASLRRLSSLATMSRTSKHSTQQNLGTTHVRSHSATSSPAMLPGKRQVQREQSAAAVSSQLQMVIHQLTLIPQRITSDASMTSVTSPSFSYSSENAGEAETALNGQYSPQAADGDAGKVQINDATVMNTHTSRLHRCRQKQEQRAAKIVLVVVGAFVVLWMPFFVVNVCSAHWTVLNDAKYARLWQVVVWCGYCNSALNPIIYTFFNRTFRRTISNLLRCRLRACRQLRKAVSGSIRRRK